jgi:hypothetical protein
MNYIRHSLHNFSPTILLLVPILSMESPAPLTAEQLQEVNQEILECARYGDDDDLREMLRLGGDVNFKDGGGNTALHKGALGASKGRRFVTVLLCYCVTVSLCHCVTVLLCYCYCFVMCTTTVSLCHSVTVLLCYCVTVLLCYCVTVLLCYCVTVLLCYCVTVLLYICFIISLLCHCIACLVLS